VEEGRRSHYNVWTLFTQRPDLKGLKRGKSINVLASAPNPTQEIEAAVGEVVVAIVAVVVGVVVAVVVVVVVVVVLRLLCWRLIFSVPLLRGPLGKKLTTPDAAWPTATSTR
jgi:hypothetical protein